MCDMMIHVIEYNEFANNLHINVRFAHEHEFECFMSEDEVIVRSASGIMLNVPPDSAYWKEVIEKVKWCEDNFETMRDLYYGD